MAGSNAWFCEEQSIYFEMRQADVNDKIGENREEWELCLTYSFFQKEVTHQPKMIKLSVIGFLKIWPK